MSRRVVFPLWELSSCKPQDPKTSLYYPGESYSLANTGECRTSACSHEQNRSFKTEVSLHNQELTNTIPCHRPQTGSTTASTISTLVPATTAAPRANGKRPRTAQSRTDCSITPSWDRNRPFSLISPALRHHHANLNRQAHAHGKKARHMHTWFVHGNYIQANEINTRALSRFIPYFRLNARFVALLHLILPIDPGINSYWPLWERISVGGLFVRLVPFSRCSISARSGATIFII